MITMLLMRRPPGGFMSTAIAPGDDPMRLAAELCDMHPDHHRDSEWCVIQTDDPRRARWPDPEPWKAQHATGDS